MSRPEWTLTDHLASIADSMPSTESAKKIWEAVGAIRDMVTALRGAMVLLDSIGCPEAFPRGAWDARRAQILAAISKAEGRVP